MSRRVRRGIRALAREGFNGGLFNVAFRYAGEKFISDMLARLGYTWDTKAQDWKKIHETSAGSVDRSGVLS